MAAKKTTSAISKRSAMDTEELGSCYYTDLKTERKFETVISLVFFNGNTIRKYI